MNPETNVGTGKTTETITFGGFILEHERSSNDVLLYNQEHVTPKLAMPIAIIEGLADRLAKTATGNTKVEFGGFILQREGTQVICYNTQSVSHQLRMPVATFEGLADKLESAGWGTRKSGAAVDLPKTGTDG